jgi:hypothetical protein
MTAWLGPELMTAWLGPELMTALAAVSLRWLQLRCLMGEPSRMRDLG